MEVAETGNPASIGARKSDAHNTQNILMHDILSDGERSSSLSEIDDVSDFESPKPLPAPENESEAETERIDESPNKYHLRTNIVVSASGFSPSPSKMAQSTVYGDIEEDEEAKFPADGSPSKSSHSKNLVLESVEDFAPGAEDSKFSDSLGKKRKRSESVNEAGSEPDVDHFPRDRRGSAKTDLSDPPPDLVLTPERIEEPPKLDETENTPVDEIPEPDLPSAPITGPRPKKSRRKHKTREVDDDVDSGVHGKDDQADKELGDDDTAERPEDADAGEAAAKLVEDSVKRTSAMDSLSVLEREFAILRDKIYDERISKLNRELDMLTGSNPTHPELLRQLECVKRYTDAKVDYEHTLFRYRLKSLVNKSLAERAQTHSSYIQRIRDIRERHSSAISKQFYSIQHDRFKTDDVSPQHYIPFPTRRSQQIANQTAYNQEVSILAGVAKYVGFPAASSLVAARPSEIDEDLEKMGITVETKVFASQHQSTVPPGVMSTIPSSVYHTSAEEAFLEQTPWANPQHPIHHYQQRIPQRPQSRISENPRAPTYNTPAGQMRVVDVNAPNGSASTIAENSSANNTPYGNEQEHPVAGAALYPQYEADRQSGFRSLSASPLDVRKPHPAPYPALDHRSAQGTSRNPDYSPPPTRLGFFQSATSK
ncbi:hypothetical protein ARAM_001803 [Aspergillus rambellii]|uniref:Uncharacterized protein n=1 Tax=Aspergillus rambellii TaxID=308745 RepID=A0A0F8U916_9EURO|nr:hypothetical protein ARAM_001803 [Aspergillus rambellii]